MERVFPKSLRAFMAALLAAAMAVPFTGGGASQHAWADEPVAAAAPLAAEPAAQANENVKLTIKAGAATPVDGQVNTYCFPDLKVSTEPADAKFQSITVQFTTGIAAGDDIYYNSKHEKNESEALPAGFTRFAGNKTGNRSINYTVEGGATAEQWEEFLSTYLTLSLADATNTKGLRLVASLAPVSTTRDYNSLNGHYYEVGTGSIGWLGALKEAEKHTYMGMQGYLVTVTSRAEQDFVFSLVHTDTWIGGTCDDTHTRRTNEWAQTYRTNNANVATRWADTTTYNAGGYSHYYWVSGPEAGLKMGECRSNSERKPAINPETNEEMFMFWASAQPDGYSTGERWMQLAVNFGATAADTLGQWNDLPRDYSSVKYYVIEYGGMPDDKDPDDEQAGADVSLDVYVKVDIIVDPTGRTITTEADDIQVGESVAVRENVNGDPEVNTHVFNGDDVEQDPHPATIKRTYQVKDPATGAWRDLLPDEMNAAGEPVHAGTYKVTSTAVYSEREDGTVIQEYVAGEATFTIKPRAVDVTEPATTPADPSAPDATQDAEVTDPDTGEKVTVSGRNWSKVYDGTPYMPGANVSMADGTVAGASAWLSFDYAEFAASDAGTCDLVLHGARVEGPNAGDYRLAGIAADGTLTVHGAITPRELVVSTRWFQAAGTDPAGWVRGVPFADPAGAPIARYTDAAPFADAAATGSASDGAGGHTWPVSWPENMLAPGDALDEVLGDAAFSAATAGGLALNAANPQLGTYALNVSFANVSASQGGALVTADGNYRVTLRPAALAVTERRTVNLTEDGPIEVVKPVQPVKPTPDPVTKDDLVDIAEDVFGPDAPAPSGGKIPEGVEPVVTIKKGGVPVNEIDPSVPGEYEVTVTYPAPDGTDYVVEVDYVVEKDPLPSPGNGLFSVTTRLVGATQGAIITPSQTLKAGASGDVVWTAGPDCYVASVEVDGKAVSLDGARWTFQNLSANHEVVVTLARNPIIEGSSTGGFYTVTVNRYGGAGAAVSPSAVLSAGEDGRATWAPADGYRIAAVWVDGKELPADAVARGSYDFAKIAANHVVDVYVERADGAPALRADDLLVTTQIKGGPGTITGSSTVTAGGEYHVEWQPVVQTTPDVDDPSYAVYEVASVQVNGAEAAGTDERELELSDIKEDKDVVVTLRPVVYDVSVLAYGPGSAAASRTLFKGQSYADIFGKPSAGAHVSYVEMDGRTVFDETENATARAAANAVEDAASAARALVGRAVAASAGAEPSPAALLGLAADTAYADSAPRTFDPVFPEPATDVRQADASALDMGISGVNADHVVKVYFAADGDVANPDTVTDKADVTAGVEGGPGSVTVGDGTGFVDPDEDQVVTWEIPEGYEPTEIVVGDKRIPVPPGATEVVIPGGTLKPGDHVELVVEKREPGDETVPSREQQPEAAEQLRVETSLAGGEGTITGGAYVDRHGNYTVEWAPAPGYRVAKVIVDGVERPDLLEAGSYTFEDIGENHTIQIVLEPVDGPDGNGSGDGDGDGDGSGSGDDGNGGGSSNGDGPGDGESDGDGAWKTLKSRLSLAQTGDELLGVAGVALALALGAGILLLAVRRRIRA